MSFLACISRAVPAPDRAPSWPRGPPVLDAGPHARSRSIRTIYVRFNVAYGAPAPREGVQPEEGGTLQGWGYIRMLP